MCAGYIIIMYAVDIRLAARSCIFDIRPALPACTREILYMCMLKLTGLFD